MFHKHKSSTIKLNSNIDICFLQHKISDMGNMTIYNTHYKLFMYYLCNIKKNDIIITQKTKNKKRYLL